MQISDALSLFQRAFPDRNVRLFEEKPRVIDGSSFYTIVIDTPEIPGMDLKQSISEGNLKHPSVIDVAIRKVSEQLESLETKCAK